MRHRASASSDTLPRCFPSPPLLAAPPVRLAPRGQKAAAPRKSRHRPANGIAATNRGPRTAAAPRRPVRPPGTSAGTPFCDVGRRISGHTATSPPRVAVLCGCGHECAVRVGHTWAQRGVMHGCVCVCVSVCTARVPQLEPTTQPTASPAGHTAHVPVPPPPGTVPVNGTCRQHSSYKYRARALARRVDEQERGRSTDPAPPRDRCASGCPAGHAVARWVGQRGRRLRGFALCPVRRGRLP